MASTTAVITKVVLTRRKKNVRHLLSTIMMRMVLKFLFVNYMLMMAIKMRELLVLSRIHQVSI